MAFEAPNETFKLLLIGNAGVGKSSILLRFTDDEFRDLPPTVGLDFRVKSISVDDINVKLTIWDTAGQERFKTMSSMYYRGAHGVILVYDVTRLETLEGLKETWLKEVELYSTKKVIKLLIGNKIDEERQISTEKGQDFARANGMIFVETSAKTSEGVQEAFLELLRKILDTPELCENADLNSVRLNNIEDEGASCSC